MELKATRNTKLFCLVMVLLMIFGIFINTGINIYADDNAKKVTNVNIEEQKKQAVENLKFYLEEAGHIDPMTHQYIPTDLAALKAKSELPGEEGIAGKFIFDNYVIPSMTRDLQKYAACVVLNSLPFSQFAKFNVAINAISCWGN